MARSMTALAYEDARHHLLNAGVVLDNQDRAVIEEHRKVLREFAALFTDWEAFCLARLVWTLSALDWVPRLGA